MTTRISAQISRLDTELVNIVKDFLLLSPLSWEKATMQDFLAQVAKKNFILPKVEYNKVSYSHKITSLEKYIKKIGKADHPALKFLKKSAISYLDAYHILQGIGTKEVNHYSKKLYGSPKDQIPNYSRRNVDVARYFVRVVDSYQCTTTNNEILYPASKFKKLIGDKIKRHISHKDDPIDITIDNKISAKATAGFSYLKLRKNTKFSQDDLDQLFHHEIMIHVLTFINGRKQKSLKMLGYNAPCTTATQEGLAVFSEYINSAIDLVRLKRIALRILAIDMAEKGADFIDLFRFFNQKGQTHEESYFSAMRIFRGGLPKGGVIFYKDNVYLRGLIDVYSFLTSTMHEGNIHDINLLFCGKLSITDIPLLKELYARQLILEPTYMPKWAKNSNKLATHLAINDLSERFEINK